MELKTIKEFAHKNNLGEGLEYSNDKFRVNLNNSLEITYINNLLNNIKQTLNTVYKVKGSTTVANINSMTVGNAMIGYVYNLLDSGVITNGIEGELDVVKGGNIVYTEEGWDEFAVSLDLDLDQCAGLNISIENDVISAIGYKYDKEKESFSIGSAAAAGLYSHAEGQNTTAYGKCSHVEGYCSLKQVTGYNWELNSQTINFDSAQRFIVGSILKIENNGENLFVKVTSVSGDKLTITVDKQISLEYNNSSLSRVFGVASGDYSHAEGYHVGAYGIHSHAEGYYTTTLGKHSHAEGDTTSAIGQNSHAEGSNTEASGYSSHAECNVTTASGDYSHAEGSNTEAKGEYSHAEGFGSQAIGEAAHAEGKYTQTQNEGEHAQGRYNKSNIGTIHSIGIGTTSSNRKNAQEVMQNGDHYIIGVGNYNGANIEEEGVKTLQEVLEDISSTASEKVTYTAGENISIEENAVNALGYTYNKEKDSFSIGSGTAIGQNSYAEGYGTVAVGDYSHAEGFATTASGYASHAEGSGLKERLYNYTFNKNSNVITFGYYNTLELDYYILIERVNLGVKDSIIYNITSIPEEGKTITVDKNLDFDNNDDTILYIIKNRPIASGDSSHVEGRNTKAEGDYSHAEGHGTVASGDISHSEGNGTVASGWSSHSEGDNTSAIGQSSHAEGSRTTANNTSEHAQGKYNISNTGTTADKRTIHSIGIGTYKAEKNAQEVMQNGDHYIVGIGDYDGTNIETAKTLQEVINGLNNKEIPTIDHLATREELTTEVNTLNEKISNIVHPEDLVKSVNGLVGEVVLEIPSVEGLATTEELNSAISGLNIPSIEGLVNSDTLQQEVNTLNQKIDNLNIPTLPQNIVNTINGQTGDVVLPDTSTLATKEEVQAVNTRIDELNIPSDPSNVVTKTEDYQVTLGTDNNPTHEKTLLVGTGLTTSNNEALVVGAYNNAEYFSTWGVDAPAIQVGAGTEDSKRTVMVIQKNGKSLGLLGFEQNGFGDFAEYFEWADGNPEGEDRVGYMVLLNEDKIELAESLDNCIGIITGTGAFVADAACLDWHGRYLKDKWGRNIYALTGVLAENPEYDPTKEYIPREYRKEWAPVGLVGKVLVRQDGTLKPNGFVGCVNGIATNVDKSSWRVLKVIDEEIALVLIK